MKVLQLGKFYPVRGGVEKVMRDLTQGLSAHGVDCDMLCCMLPSDPVDAADRPMARTEGRMRIITLNAHGRILCVPAWRKAAATMLSPALVCYLRRHAVEYDLIHVHHPDPMAALALRLSGYRGPVVLHWHSDILKQRFLLKLYRPLQRWLCKRAGLIVGTTPVYVAESPWLADFQHKTTYVPIGIHPMPAGAKQPDPGSRTIFSIGRLVSYKGYRYLIEAMKYLPDYYRLIIGGEGPLRTELQAQIDHEGLTDRVRLAGYVADEDLPSYFSGCDVYAVSSIWKTEAFCIAQIEAMSAGRPVVATEIPGSGVSWVNAAGVSGLNASPENAQALAEALRAVADNPGTRAAYAARARRRYEELFTLEAMTAAVLRLYHKLTEK